MPTKDTLFRPTASQTKAAGTHAAAMLIIDDETAARTAKTKRLRNARLEREAAETKPEPKPKRRKAAAPKKAVE